MRVGPYLERLDQALWLSRILQLTLLAMTIAILALARQSTIVHVAPPDFRAAYDIGPSTASRDYIEQMASFLIVNALTVSPDSAAYAARAFLRFLTPEARGKLEAAVLGDAEWIRRHGVSQAFYPRSIDFRGPTTLRVSGTLVQWTAGRLTASRDVAVDLQVLVADYHLKIKDMRYVEDAPRAAGPGGAAPAAPGS